MLLNGAVDLLSQEFALSPKDFDYSPLNISLHGRNCRGEGMRFGTVGRGKKKDARLIVVQTSQAHDVALPCQCGDRKTIAQPFSEGGEMRHDTDEISARRRDASENR